MEVQPYLFFDGRCDEAIAFYHEVLGAETAMLVRFRNAPDPAMVTPANADKVMHARLKIGGTTMLLSDGRCMGNPKFQGFALSLALPDIASAEQQFAALSKDGRVHMPLGKTFFSPAFGMVMDKFGVHWMVSVEA